MYNGGIFGGAPTGPLGVGVPSGWGNVDENKDREPSKESDKTEKMRNDFLGWRTRASFHLLKRESVGVERGSSLVECLRTQVWTTT